MAEAFARMLGGAHVEAYSAGSQPSGVVNPKAIEAMRELEYDLSAHGSKSLDALPDVEFDCVVTMGCGETCPFIRARQRTEWAVPDPRHRTPAGYRDVRNHIRELVRTLLLELGIPASER